MDTSASPGPARRLVLIAPDDAAFAAGFLPLVAAARSTGLSASVVTRVSAHRAEIEAAGARVVAFALGTSRLNPMAAGDAAGRLAGILKALEADAVHALGLRAIVTGGTAAAMAGVSARIYQPDGLGALAARADAASRLSRLALRHAIRGPLATRATRYLCASPADAAALALDPADTGVSLVGAEGLAAAAGPLYAELALP